MTALLDWVTPGVVARAFVPGEHPRGPHGEWEVSGDAGADTARRRLAEIPGLLGVHGQIQSPAGRRLAATVGDLADELAEGPDGADWDYIRGQLPVLADAERAAAKRGEAGEPSGRLLAGKLAELRAALENLAAGRVAARGDGFVPSEHPRGPGGKFSKAFTYSGPLDDDYDMTGSGPGGFAGSQTTGMGAEYGDIWQAAGLLPPKAADDPADGSKRSPSVLIAQTGFAPGLRKLGLGPIMPGSPARDQLAARVEAGIAEADPLGQGRQANTEILTLADGSQAVAKSFFPWNGLPARQLADAEELSSIVAEAITGTGAAPVVRTGENRTVSSYLPGKVAAAAPSLPTSYLRSDRARRIGLLDKLIDNQDRHKENWLVQDHQAFPIDHSGGFGVSEGGGNASPFAAQLDVPPPLFTEAELDEIQARLVALSDAFRQRERQNWHAAMIARLLEVRKVQAHDG